MAIDEKGPSHRVYKSKFRPFDGISKNKFLSGAGVSSWKRENIGGQERGIRLTLPPSSSVRFTDTP